MDIRPLKPGHALLIPKTHYETIKDLPAALLQPLMIDAQRIARAVEIAFKADGSFSGYNTHVSQSVPHFHMHIVPRKFGDKLFAGGRWLRLPYKSEDVANEFRDKLKSAMEQVIATNPRRARPLCLAAIATSANNGRTLRSDPMG